VAALSATDYARVGPAAAALWLLTFGSGLVVYEVVHLLW